MKNYVKFILTDKIVMLFFYHIIFYILKQKKPEIKNIKVQ